MFTDNESSGRLSSARWQEYTRAKVNDEFTLPIEVFTIFVWHLPLLICVHTYHLDFFPNKNAKQIHKGKNVNSFYHSKEQEKEEHVHPLSFTDLIASFFSLIAEGEQKGDGRRFIDSFAWRCQIRMQMYDRCAINFNSHIKPVWQKLDKNKSMISCFLAAIAVNIKLLVSCYQSTKRKVCLDPRSSERLFDRRKELLEKFYVLGHLDIEINAPVRRIYSQSSWPVNVLK